MITLKTLTWSNAFSYGADNKIDFASSPIVQLVGKNGHGKSSIALILEEVLFNKNSKSIKKGDILNRYVSDKAYTISLTFSKDADEYVVETRRGSTQTVKLFKNGVDISSHTSTATYKQVQDILEMDHRTFAQIVYQSNASSLEFLTAADTARKKFLIELLGLDQYTRAGEVFKAASAELNKDVAASEAKVQTVTRWLDKYKTSDLTTQELVPVPEPLDESIIKEMLVLEQQVSSIDVQNKKIAANNANITLQAKIELLDIPAEPDESAIKALEKQISVAEAGVAACAAFVKKLQGLHGTCPTCMSAIDTCTTDALIAEKQQEQQAHQASVDVATTELNALKLQKNKYVAAVKRKTEYDKYEAAIDRTLPTEPLVKAELEAQLTALREQQKDNAAKISIANTKNKAIEAANAKVDALVAQIQEFEGELATHSAKVQELAARQAILGILTKTFSTNGLIAYKIESLVKDLEELTNNYLVELSDGRFQISFQISGSDKLNVVITDNGNDIDILALSGGERARVNAATLLAIRKLMQGLSSSRINLLILDETVEALDQEGKEKLIEVLIKEDSLNTYLVSHGFTHPLLEKVHVVKQNNISRIEE